MATKDPVKLKEQRRQHYLKNREKILSRQKEYAASHREEKRIYDASHHAKNREKFNTISSDYYEKNKDKCLRSAKTYYQTHKEEKHIYNSVYAKIHSKELAEYRKQYYEKNREDILSRNAEYNILYCKENKGKRAALGAKRRALLKQAILSEKFLSDIQSIYILSHKLTVETGIVHHVDHDVPLNHPLVCGLHVPWNLRVLTAKQNLAKGNKFDPETYEPN